MNLCSAPPDHCLYSRTWACNLPQLKIAHDMYIDWSFCSLCFCCYCVILVLMFICHSASTITVEQQQQQQQHKSNLDKLLNVQELISPIHIPLYDVYWRLNMKWANTCTALATTHFVFGSCMSRWPYLVLLLATRYSTRRVHLHGINKHWVMYVTVLLLLLQFHVVVVQMCIHD